jgi:hypothetical protein
MHRNRIPTAIVACLFACSGEGTGDVRHPFDDDIPAVSVEHLTEIPDRHDAGLQTICGLAAWANYGAGLFTVVDLVGVVESSECGDCGMYYVVLHQDESWWGRDDDEVVLRTEPGSLGIRLGEQAVLLIRSGSEAVNEGFPMATTSTRFRWLDGAWSSRGHQYSTEVLRSAIQAAYDSFLPGEFDDSDATVIDVDFDRCPDESLIPLEALP